MTRAISPPPERPRTCPTLSESPGRRPRQQPPADLANREARRGRPLAPARARPHRGGPPPVTDPGTRDPLDLAMAHGAVTFPFRGWRGRSWSLSLPGGRSAHRSREGRTGGRHGGQAPRATAGQLEELLLVGLLAARSPRGAVLSWTEPYVNARTVRPGGLRPVDEAACAAEPCPGWSLSCFSVHCRKTWWIVGGHLPRCVRRVNPAAPPA
eukprot:scaffold200_cov401-Prasinococcus_capsulatus_cf.AAC.11